MHLKNQPTVMMPKELMFEVEREWGMSKAAWIDVAWDVMQQLLVCEGVPENDHEQISKALKDRAELIQMYRKRAKSAA